VVAVNGTLLTINAGDYIFYTDWAWTSFVVFSISQTLMLVVGACYYLTFTGVPGTATYYALIITVYTWVAKGAWFALGYPYDFIVTPIWLPSAMLLDLAYWATKRNKHSLILFGGVLVKPDYSSRSTRDCIQVSKTHITTIHDTDRTAGRKVL